VYAAILIRHSRPWARGNLRRKEGLQNHREVSSAACLFEALARARGVDTRLHYKANHPDFLLELKIDQEGTEQPKADAIRTLLEKWVERIER
jgi:hypothetical protein